MKELHWLPVRQRIEFKINMITYKGKNNLAPGYVSDMTEAYNRPKLNMTLRSSKQTDWMKSGQNINVVGTVLILYVDQNCGIWCL